jgi:hypothetical protein
MVTTKQENLYNEIIEYYALVDSLVQSAANNENDSAAKQFEIIEELVSCIEENCDVLAKDYINFVKNGASDKITESTKTALNKISAKIAECRDRIANLYSEE